MTDDHVEPLQAELKQVTVLFVDLVSSTELVAHLDAESAMQQLEPVLQIMCETVQRFAGTIARTLGDGIMALFGAPVAQEGHAVLACQAALAIREAISAAGSGHMIRAGLHSGEIVSDAPIGGAAGISSAYGVTLHLGSRLAAQVEPGDICISEASYHLVSSFCETRPIGHRALRGVPQPVMLYSLVGMRLAVAVRRFRNTAPPSFLGRDRELELLTQTLCTVEAGAGQIVGIAGVPGAGKSRLCYEFAETCRARSVPVFETRSQPYGVAAPLQPVLDLLRTAYFHIAPGDGSESAIAIVANELKDIGTTDESDLALVCELLRLPFKATKRAWLSARTSNARLQEIVRSLAIRHGATTSVMIIEDLHWLDAASNTFIATLANAVAAVRTMLIVNFRHPYSCKWMQVSNYQEIDLAELATSDTDSLVKELIGSCSELDEIRRRVVERSGGNPFFAEELVQCLAESGVVVGRRGAFRRGHAVNMETLPPTVQAVISARIDGLTPQERHVLQVSSIIGKEFRVAILKDVTGQGDYALAAILDRLCDAELLRQGDTFDGPTYQFRHPLTQEVAYATQLRSRRSVLHAAVADAIERLHADRSDEYAALVAHHLEEAGERNRAAFHAARAAHWIGQMGSEQAMRLWQKVRTLMTGEPRSSANDALRIEASSQIAWLGWREGLTTDQARPYVQEALHWAREIDDSIIPLLLFVDGRIAQVSGGNSDMFVQQIKQAISLAESSHDTGRLATLNAALSHAYGWAGLLRQALEASDAAVANVADVTDFDQRFLGYSVENWILGLRGRILLRLGRFDAARACFDKLIGIMALIDPTVLFIAHFGYVDMAWCHNDPTMAVKHAGRIDVLAERHGGAYLRLYQLASKAIADGIAGDYEAAVDGIVRSIAFLRQTGAAIEFEPELLASLADFYMRKSDHGRAITTAMDAVAMARLRGARLPACRAIITLASLTILTEDAGAYSRAKALLAEAERLIEESGACIYEGRLNEARTLLADFSR
jgi:class 3 adenylate cyclase/tetratricopeptide (TPR) repeat protein